MKKIILPMLLILVFIWPAVSFATTVHKIENGKLDWSTGTIEAECFYEYKPLSGEATNLAPKWYQAKEIALATAHLELVKIINKIPVSSNLTVGELAKNDKELGRLIDQIATETDFDKIDYLENGMVKVYVSKSIFGKNGLIDITNKALTKNKDFEDRL